jgi:hypothetical protein
VIRFPATQGKPDANQKRLKAYMEALGATVEILPTGRGVPDAAVGFKGVNMMVEFKTEKGKLNDLQVAWHDNWRGQVAVVRTEEDCDKLLGFDTPPDERFRQCQGNDCEGNYRD